MKSCQNYAGKVNSSDLKFPAKFWATYLFVKVIGSRLMIYRYLTVEMVKAAKINSGFIHQKTLKTTGKYRFYSVILTDTSMQILNGYINFVRPLLKSQCDFVLVTKNGRQRSKLGNKMSKLLFDAIGKYIHPTRYAKSLKRKVFLRLTTKSTKFCLKTKTIALSLPKCTIRSGGCSKLL